MSGFNAEKFVAWKKSKGMYSFTQVPKTVVLSPQNSSFKNLNKLFPKKIKGITGQHTLYSENILLSTDFGLGAPALIALCEELRVLGVEKFIFIGMAGRLSEKIQEAEFCFISQAISELGITNSYQKDEIQKVEQFVSLKFKESICWSTDSPFRETEEKILKYQSMQAAFVDMEVAALYSFANFYDLKANAFLVGADLVTEKKWEAVSDINQLNVILANTTEKIVKSL